ncbi:hypothetical protein GGI07_000103 [Coemansia sp. Benny D115]|nr:hypothetical protein GGI07_000103 [Coemansia sp. Benny D115]
MDVGSIAGICHLVLGSFLLWVVPAQFLFFVDLVAFLVSLFLLLRDIVSRWYLTSAAQRISQQQQPVIVVTEQGIDASSPVGESTSLRPASNNVRPRNIQRMLSVNASANASSLAKPKSKYAMFLENLIKGKAKAHRLPMAKTILLALQLVLFAMVLDFVYRPLIFPGNNLTIFRPGYVSHDSARLHIRYSEGGDLELRYRVVQQGELGVGQDAMAFAHGTARQRQDNAPWESAGVFGSPTDATDYTTTTALINLRPSTKYLVELHSRQPTLHSSSAFLGSVEFKTAPRPSSPTKMRFGTGSCIKPNFPYRPTLSPEIYGFDSMLQHSDGLDMIMFMGDFIYADLPVYFGTSAEDYRRLYRQVYMTQSSKRLLRKVPMLHVYDDHEIKNNWHNQDDEPMPNAMIAYHEYNGMPNPPPEAPAHSFYNFTHGNVAFYAWDTRRYRTLWETPDGVQGKTMLGAEQKQHFFQWLRDVNHTAAVKFVISSVPVTTSWTSFDSSQDTWRGYPTERAEILELTKYVPNLFFLSGDRHEMAAVELVSGNIEFSTSPISQFTFPFFGKFKRDVDGEKTLHYRRPGHVKYGIVDVDTESDPIVPRVTYSLYTADVHDGRLPAWVYEAKGVPWK